MYKVAIIVLMATGAAVAAPAWKVNDSMGNPILEISNIQCAPQDVGCEMTASATNISNAPVTRLFLMVTIHWTSGGAHMVDLHPEPFGMIIAPGETGEYKGKLMVPHDFLRERGKPKSIDIERSGMWKSRQEQERRKKFDEDVAEAHRAVAAACATTYRVTIDKAEKDLTVRERLQIARCISDELYKP